MKSCRVFSLSLQVGFWPKQHSGSKNVVGQCGLTSCWWPHPLSGGYRLPSDTRTLGHLGVTQGDVGMGDGWT